MIQTFLSGKAVLLFRKLRIIIIEKERPLEYGNSRESSMSMNRTCLYGIVVLCLSFFLFSCKIPPVREAQDLFPYLEMPTPDSITITWRTSTEKDGAVRYGLTPPLDMEVSDPTPAEWHSFTLTGLVPDKEYAYQAFSGGEPVGDVYSFRTAPRETVPFVFSVVGDTMYSEPEKLQIKEGILEDDPSFVIHVGDFVAELGGYEEKLWRRHYFEDYWDLLCRIPVIPVLGNHEYQGLIMVFFSIPGAAPLFHDYFTLPNNERWFSFDWANCHFIVLDANIPKDLEEGEQLDWLVQDLQQSTDGVQDPDWIFVSWHEPAFSSGMGQFDLMGENLRNNIVPLMEEYGVDIVFYGHDHFYERSFKDGVTYILTGGGGAAPHPIFDDINPYSQVVVDSFQYMRVSVNGLLVQVESVDPLMTVLDSFTIEKEPPSPPEGGFAANSEGGCGCSVVQDPSFSETPLGTAFVLLGVFGAWMVLRRRSCSGGK